MLVEADPSGGSLLGWCEQLRPAGDLYDLTMNRNSAGVASVAQPMGDLSVVPSWGRSFRLTQALTRPRVPWDALLGGFDGTVIVDVGRRLPRGADDGPPRGRATSSCSSPPPSRHRSPRRWSGPAAAAVTDRRTSACRSGRLRMITSEVVGRRRAMSVTPRDLSLVTGAGYLGHLPHDPALARAAVPRCVDRATGRLRRSRLVDAGQRRSPARSPTRRRPGRELVDDERRPHRHRRRPQPTGRSDPPRVRRAAPGRRRRASRTTSARCARRRRSSCSRPRSCRRSTRRGCGPPTRC